MRFGAFATKTKQSLIALKIFDPDMTLSLTNVGVMVLIGKIATAPTIDWPTTASLMLALLAYNHKKILRSKEKARADDGAAKLKEMEDKIAEINKAFAVSTMFKK